MDACPVGGTAFFPSGDYHVPSGGLVVSRAITLRGESGTRLIAFSLATNQPVIRIVPGGQLLQNVELHDLLLTNPSQPTQTYAGNHGIVCDVPANGSKVAWLLLDRVSVYAMGDDGIRLTAYGGATDSFFVFVTCRRLDLTLNKGHGMYIQVATGVSFQDCFFNANDRCGLFAKSAEVNLSGAAFESNCRGTGLDLTWDAQARIENCLLARFDACRWEEFTTSEQTTKRGLTILNSPGCSVSNCFFVNSVLSTSTQERGIYCSYGTSPPIGPGVMASVFYGNVFQNVKTSLEIDGVTNPALDCVVFPQFATSGSGAMLLPLDVSNNGLLVFGGRPAPSGSTPAKARGLLAPVMASSDIAAIGSTEVGRVIYDKDARRLRYWDGTEWRNVQTVI